MMKLYVTYATWKSIAQANNFTAYEQPVGAPGADTRHIWAGSRDVVYRSDIDASNKADYDTNFPSPTVVPNEDEAIALIINLAVLLDPRTNDGFSIVSAPTSRKIVNSALKLGGTGSPGMDVDGSVTEQEFKWEPASADIIVQEICMIAEIDTAAFGNKFLRSALSTLTNGLLVQIKSNDVSFNYGNLKRTRDVVELADGPGLDIVSAATTLFRVTWWVPEAGLFLAKDGTFGSPDFLKATVRDDLTSITFLEIFFQGVKL